MKRFAIKGLAALAAVVALCMFFSGTMKTLSTAKVKIVTAKSGKLEERLSLEGTLVFPETEEIGVSGLSAGQSVTVRRVRVAKGRRVKAGDVLLEGEVEGLEAKLDELTKTCEDAQKELLELERKNGEMRLKRTEELWIEAYDALAAAKAAQLEAQTALVVAARMADVELDGGRLPEGVKEEELLACQQAVDDADAAAAQALRSFQSANRLGISEDVVTAITKTRELEAKISDAQAQIAELTVLRERARAVVAPHDGTIVEVSVKAGDSIGEQTVAVVMSADKSRGVLRVQTDSTDRRIEKGTQTEAGNDGGKTVTKKVTDTGMTEEGKPYVDIELGDKDITSLGGAASLMSTPVKVTVSYRASSSTTLLPVSAVRGTGEQRYVYVISDTQNALGEQTLKVTKQDVKVLAEVGGTASLETDLSRQRIAYMEDRPIEDGSEVMLYAK